MFARCKAGFSSIVKGAGYLIFAGGTAAAFGETIAIKPNPSDQASWFLLTTFLASSAAATADLSYSALSSLVEGIKKCCVTPQELQQLEEIEIDNTIQSDAKVENPSSPSWCSTLKSAANFGLGVTTGLSTLLAGLVTLVSTGDPGGIGRHDGKHDPNGVTEYTVFFGYCTLSLLIATIKFFANSVNHCQSERLHNSRNTLFGTQSQARLLEQDAVLVTDVKSENIVRPGQG